MLPAQLGYGWIVSVSVKGYLLLLPGQGSEHLPQEGLSSLGHQHTKGSRSENLPALGEHLRMSRNGL